MPRRIETLFIPGPAGRLEAILEEPEDQAPTQAAIVCHPHPLHGGTLHNKVVHRMARGLRRAQSVVLRFNFRGVNLSEGTYDNGVGEVADARAALALLEQRYPGLPLTLAGFSFGSRVALFLAQQSPHARHVIATGFPAHLPDTDKLLNSPIPRLFVHSTHDVICDPAAAEAFFHRLQGPNQFHYVEASDHFFSDALPDLEQLIANLAIVS